MSYKIKIFESSKPENLQDRINDFLESLNVITLKDIKYTYTPESSEYPNPWYTAMVIYSFIKDDE